MRDERAEQSAVRGGNDDRAIIGARALKWVQPIDNGKGERESQQCEPGDDPGRARWEELNETHFTEPSLPPGGEKGTVSNHLVFGYCAAIVILPMLVRARTSGAYMSSTTPAGTTYDPGTVARTM